MSKPPEEILTADRFGSNHTKPIKDAGVERNTKSLTIVLIEERLLVRDCIARTLRLHPEFTVVSFPSVAEWTEGANKVAASLILWCNSGQDDPRMQKIALLAQQKGVPIIIVSDAEDIDHIICALN